MNKISGIVSATKNALIPFTVPIACCSAIRKSIAIADSDNNRLLYKILNKLMEIVKLIGEDVLPDDQKLIIEIARVIKNGYLQQEYFSENDTFVSITKQLKMMRVILHYYKKMREAITLKIPMSTLLKAGLSEKLIRMKYDVPKDDCTLIEKYEDEITVTLDSLMRERG